MKRWPPGAVERLHQLYGLYTIATIQDMLANEFGRPFTWAAVTRKAQGEGLDFRDAQGYLTISEAARQIGVAKKNVCRAIRRLGIKTKGAGRACYLADEDVERLRAAIGHPAVETVSTAEAAVLLNIALSTVLKYVRNGKLRAIRRGKLWRLPADQFQRYDQWGRDRLTRGAA